MASATRLVGLFLLRKKWAELGERTQALSS